jgi:hypothetical protein
MVEKAHETAIIENLSGDSHSFRLREERKVISTLSEVFLLNHASPSRPSVKEEVCWLFGTSVHKIGDLCQNIQSG